MKQNPLSTSGKLFCEAGIQNCGRTLRCKILSTIGKIVHPIRQPPLSDVHRSKRVAWAKQYMKLDGPDRFCRGWLHTAAEIPHRLRRQQAGGGVMFWAGIVYNQVVRPFRVPEGVKMDSNSYQLFLRQNFEPWYHGLPPNEKKSLVFMQDNAPSHAAKIQCLASIGIFGSRLMNWHPASPDLNPIENFWGIIKRNVYAKNEQFHSVDDLWRAIVNAAKEIDPNMFKKLTSSTEKLLKMIRLDGGYIRN